MVRQALRPAILQATEQALADPRQRQLLLQQALEPLLVVQQIKPQAIRPALITVKI